MTGLPLQNWKPHTVCSANHPTVTALLGKSAVCFIFWLINSPVPVAGVVGGVRRLHYLAFTIALAGPFDMGAARS